MGMTHATPEDVREQFFKTLRVCTRGSESLRMECEEAYRQGRGSQSHRQNVMPLFDNKTENKSTLSGGDVDA